MPVAHGTNYRNKASYHQKSQLKLQIYIHLSSRGSHHNKHRLLLFVSFLLFTRINAGMIQHRNHKSRQGLSLITTGLIFHTSRESCTKITTSFNFIANHDSYDRTLTISANHDRSCLWDKKVEQTREEINSMSWRYIHFPFALPILTMDMYTKRVKFLFIFSVNLPYKCSNSRKSWIILPWLQNTK